MKDHRHTQRGECQVCGHFQACAVGTYKLAEHGYTTRHGFFEGRCFGSFHLPLELDKSIIVQIISNVEEDLKDMRAVYEDYTKRKSGSTKVLKDVEASKMVKKAFGVETESKWVEVEIRGDNKAEWDAPTHYYPRGRFPQSTAEQAFPILNLRYLNVLNIGIDQRVTYIKWQNGRLKAWQARPLIDVEKTERAKRDEIAARRAERLRIKEEKEAKKRTNKTPKPENVEQARKDVMILVERPLYKDYDLHPNHLRTNERWKCVINTTYGGCAYIDNHEQAEAFFQQIADNPSGKISVECRSCCAALKKCKCRPVEV